MVLPILNRLRQHIDDERRGSFMGQDLGAVAPRAASDPMARVGIGLANLFGLIGEGGNNAARASTGAMELALPRLLRDPGFAATPQGQVLDLVAKLGNRVSGGALSEMAQDTRRGWQESDPNRTVLQRLMQANDTGAYRHKYAQGALNVAMDPSNLLVLAGPLAASSKTPTAIAKLARAAQFYNEWNGLGIDKGVGILGGGALKKLGVASEHGLTPATRAFLRDRAGGAMLGGATGGANAQMVNAATPGDEGDTDRLKAGLLAGALGGGALGGRRITDSASNLVGRDGGFVARRLAQQAGEQAVPDLLGSGVGPGRLASAVGSLRDRIERAGVGRNLDTFMADAYPLLKNEDGTPKVFYHGTLSGDFDQFETPVRAGEWGRGVYFTENPQYANGYATGAGRQHAGVDNLREIGEAQPNVKPVYVNLKNPYVVGQDPRRDADLFGSLNRMSSSETLQREGYDGVVVPGNAFLGTPGSQANAVDEMVVFDPARSVKSATGNIGTYDRNNPSLLRSGLTPEDLTGSLGKLRDTLRGVGDSGFPSPDLPEGERRDTLASRAADLLSGGWNRFIRAEPIPSGEFAPGNLRPDKARVEQFLDSLPPEVRPVNVTAAKLTPEERVAAFESNTALAEQMGLDAPATPDDWAKSIAIRGGTTADLAPPPTVAMQFARDPQALAQFFADAKRSMPEVMDAAAHGLEFRDTMLGMRRAGQFTPEMAAKSWLWIMLSNNAAPFPHEGNFIMASNPYFDPIIAEALRGFSSPAEKQRWLNTSAEAFVQYVGGRQGVAEQGARATAEGKIVPPRVAQMPYQLRRGLEAIADWSSSGAMNAWVDLLNRPDELTGRQLRREFYRLGMGGSGVDNKLLSFNLLLLGEKDVFVIDIIQARNLHEEGFWRTIQGGLGDQLPAPLGRDKDVPAKGGLLTAGTDLAAKAYGGQLAGLGRYEALEELLTPAATAVFGEPDLGALHWYLWVMRDWRAVDHGSLGPTLEAAARGLSQSGQSYGALPPLHVAQTEEGSTWATALERYFAPENANVDIGDIGGSYPENYFDRYWEAAVAKLRGVKRPTDRQQQALLLLEEFTPQDRERWGQMPLKEREALASQLTSPPRVKRGEAKIPAVFTGQVPEKVQAEVPRLRPRFQYTEEPNLKSRDAYPFRPSGDLTLGQRTEGLLRRSVTQGDESDYTFGTTFRSGEFSPEEVARRTGRIYQEFAAPDDPFEQLPEEGKRDIVGRFNAALQDPNSGFRKALADLGVAVEFNPGDGVYNGSVNPNVVFVAGRFDDAGKMLRGSDLTATLDALASALGKARNQEAAIWEVRASPQQAFARNDPRLKGRVALSLDVRLPRAVDLDTFRSTLAQPLDFTRLPDGTLHLTNWGGLPDDQFATLVDDATARLGGEVADQYYTFGRYIVGQGGVNYDQHIERYVAQGGGDGQANAGTRAAADQATGSGGAGYGSGQGVSGGGGTQRRAALQRVQDILSGLGDGGASVGLPAGGATGAGPNPRALPTGGSDPLGDKLAASTVDFSAGFSPGALGRAVSQAGATPLAGAALGAGIGFTADSEDRQRGALKGAGAGAIGGLAFAHLAPELGGAVAKAYRSAAPGLVDDTIASPQALSIAHRMAAQAQQQAGNAPGVKLTELPRQVDDAWRAQVVNTFRGLALDASSLWLLVKDFGRDYGVDRLKVKQTLGQLLDHFDDPDPIDRLGPISHTIRGWGLEGFVDKSTSLDKTLGTSFSQSDIGTNKMSTPQRFLTGMGLSFTNLKEAMLPAIGPVIGGIRQVYAPYVDTAYHVLNGFQHAAPRIAFWDAALARDLPVAAKRFERTLAPTGIDLAPLFGPGKPVSPADVELYVASRYKGLAADEVAQIKDLYQEELNTTAMQSADRIAHIFGDFRDKNAKPWKAFLGRVFPFSRYAMEYAPVGLEMIKRHPLIAGAAIAGTGASAYAASQNGEPPWNGGTIPISTETKILGPLARLRLGGQSGTVRVDPLKNFGGPLSGQSFAMDAGLPTDTTYDKAKGLIGKVGFSPHPALDSLASLVGATNRDPQPASRTANIEQAAELIPGMPMVPSIQGAFNTAKGAITGQPVRDSDPVARRYAELVYARTNKPLSDNRNLEYLERMGDVEDPLWAQAQHEVRLANLVGSLASNLTPLTNTATGEGAARVNRAYATRMTDEQLQQLAATDPTAATVASYERNIADRFNPVTQTYRGASTLERDRAVIRNWGPFASNPAVRDELLAQQEALYRRKDRP